MIPEAGSLTAELQVMVSHCTNNLGNATNGHAGSLRLSWGTTLTTSGQRKSPLLSSYPYSLPLLIPSPLPSDQIWKNCWPTLSKGPFLSRLVIQTGLFPCMANGSGPKRVLQLRILEMQLLHCLCERLTCTLKRLVATSGFRSDEFDLFSLGSVIACLMG